MCARGAEKPEIPACGHAARSQVHNRRMGNIAMRKHDHVDRFTLDHFFQIVFFYDGNPAGISAPSQNRWIARPAMSGICVAVNATT